MREFYDPYLNVVDVMTEAMKIGGMNQYMFEIIKILSGRQRSIYQSKWMMER
jgi:hypothetical protein